MGPGPTMAATASTAIPSDLSVPRFPRSVPGRRVRARPRTLPSIAPPAPPVLPEDSAGLFDWFGHRFAPSEATLLVGLSRSVEPLLETLYAGCVRAGGRVSLLEGSNRFHPFRVGERARALGIAPEEALDRIRIARAFTGYQMAALVDGWAREIRRSRPTLLVGHDVPAMFFESEFPEIEREPLLRHVAHALAETVRVSRLPLLLTTPSGLSGFPGLKESGPRLCDLVRATPVPGGLALEAYQDAARLTLVARPDGQRGLEEYDPANGEVTRWDAPYRRTARPSRSG
jgi:hypothetical protein